LDESGGFSENPPIRKDLKVIKPLFPLEVPFRVFVVITFMEGLAITPEIASSGLWPRGFWKISARETFADDEEERNFFWSPRHFRKRGQGHPRRNRKASCEL